MQCCAMSSSHMYSSVGNTTFPTSGMCAILAVQDAWCVRQCCLLLRAVAPTLIVSPLATAAWGDVRGREGSKQGSEASFTVVEMCCTGLVRVLVTEGLMEEEW